MTTLAERTSIEAGRVARHPGRFLLSVLAAPLWLAGWLAFWAVMAVTVPFRWCWAGVKLGWLDARAQATRRGAGVGRWPVVPRVKKPGPGGTG